MPAQTVIKIRRDTSTNWSSVNPTLAAGEIAFETDTNKIKVGDGSTVWASLDYASGAGTAAEITYDNVDAELIATTVKGALDELSNNKVDPADLTAVNTSADTTNFTGNLSGSDTTVQAALDTLDDLEISAGVTTSDTPPSSPSNGDLWWESDTGILYIYYDNFWVEAVSGIVGPQGESGAVISDTEPADQDVLWVDTSSSATAESTLNNGTQGLTAVSNGSAGLSYQPISHNYIINGAFDIWQRGSTYTRTGGSGNEYGSADRWKVASFASGPDVTLAQSSDIPNGLGVNYSASMSWSNSTSTGDIFLSHWVENGKYLFAGKTITLSFYAKATSSISGIRFILDQDYQSNNLSLSTSWQRYSTTFTVPDDFATNRPSGTTATDHTELRFFRLTNRNEPANTIYFTGVQLEAGSIATPFKRNANSIQGELQACEYYYRRFDTGTSAKGLFTGATVTSSTLRCMLPITMRATPSVPITAATINIYVNGSSFTSSGLSLVKIGSGLSFIFNSSGLPTRHAGAVAINAGEFMELDAEL